MLSGNILTAFLLSVALLQAYFSAASPVEAGSLGNSHRIFTPDNAPKPQFFLSTQNTSSGRHGSLYKSKQSGKASLHLVSFASTGNETTEALETSTRQGTRFCSRYDYICPHGRRLSSHSSQCCYADSCNGNNICASKGHSLTDSCGETYQVGNDCGLVAQKCYYHDACNKNLISAPKGGVLYDSCPRGYHVDKNCRLTRSNCCFIDSCNGNEVCTARGATFTDSCNVRYRLSLQCEATVV